MKTGPMLMSAPMVRALLNGTKTKTRRVMRDQPHEAAVVRVEHFNQTIIDRNGDEQPGPEIFGAWWADGECGIRCPYGQPGDRLWVREAWRTSPDANAIPPRDLHDSCFITYEADWEAIVGLGKYRPGMFMPRWASRITLEIVSVRVERLQDISEADAIAEGITILTGDKTVYHFDFPSPLPGWNVAGYQTAKAAYQVLWESINGPGSWAANPWVWVVEFKRIEGPA